MMKTAKRITRAMPVLLALAALLAAPGCEKSDPTAEPGSVLVLSASPGNINFGGKDTASSTITATLYSTSGNAKSGVGIRFSTDIGVMASGGSSIDTDGSGVAQDRLTVSSADSGSFAVVTGRSGSVDATVEVSIGFQNEAPLAVIILNGLDSQGRASPGDRILYDGTFSSDPEDGNPSHFRWNIFSTDPNSTETVEGNLATASQIQRTYLTPQEITVQLTVEDAQGLSSAPAADFFTIIDNLPPTADAGADKRTRLGQPVIVSGSGSSDPDGTIVEYEWDWEDGFLSVLPSPSSSHVYTVAAVYCVRLVVTDDDGARSDPDWMKACVYPVGEEPEAWCTDPVRERVCF